MPRTRRRGNPLARIGVLLVVIGFGSTILHSATDYQFTLIAWADGAQPYIGILLGLVGVGLLATPFILRAREGSPGSPIAPAAAFGQPTGAPQGFPQTGVPQPAPWEQQAGFGQPQQFQQPQFPQQQPFNQGQPDGGWPQR
ncbi:MAG TPA: hypothetical protein VHV74_22355 [Pseudonocardiaceae bacterium]|jgi:hypothetical protein|nr:hypothetical protein [Pseudonocardiaceae bacterium]